MATDPYQTLGISRDADVALIRKAYRKLVKELHPDVRPDDPEAEQQFKQATAAFDLLSDPDKRRRFDEGEITADGKPVSPFQNFSSGRWRSNGDSDDNIFTDLFSRYRPNSEKTRRGRDRKSSMTISFLEAINGARRSLKMSPDRNIDVNIPAGIHNAQVIRLKKQGHPSWSGGVPGDMLIEIQVEPHPGFSRDGNNVRMDLRVPLIDAVLGAKIQAQTPSGYVTLSVPPMSSSGDILRLKGKGVQDRKNPGDLLARILVILPKESDLELTDWARARQGGS